MIDKNYLERIYREYNKPEFINPDPLQFLGEFDLNEDKEIVGLIASSLAYGRVAQILKSVSKILTKMEAEPRKFILENSHDSFMKIFKGFKHRFNTGEDMVALFCGIKRALEQFGSLEECFRNGYKKTDANVLVPLSAFVDFLSQDFENKTSYLLPHPSKGSACKRMMLYLRWMVRKDDVDPGCWSGFSKAKLVIPLDTHMHQYAIKAGLTKRKQGNLKTALEITDAYRSVSPRDPVKYDFALTRFGIRDDIDPAR